VAYPALLDIMQIALCKWKRGVARRVPDCPPSDCDWWLYESRKQI